MELSQYTTRTGQPFRSHSWRHSGSWSSTDRRMLAQRL